MDIPEIRYARTVDGVDIAYQVVGKGKDDLVCFPGHPHLEYAWRSEANESFYRGLVATTRLILIDRRGTGIRGVHPTAALVLACFLYAPIGTELRDAVRFVVLPVLVVTGIAMWQAARIRRLWKTLGRRRALDPATSASPAERGAGSVARAITGGRG